MANLIVEMDMPRACRWKEDGMTKRCPIAEWGGACAVTKLFEPSDDPTADIFEVIKKMI